MSAIARGCLQNVFLCGLYAWLVDAQVAAPVLSAERLRYEAAVTEAVLSQGCELLSVLVPQMSAESIASCVQPEDLRDLFQMLLPSGPGLRFCGFIDFGLCWCVCV